MLIPSCTFFPALLANAATSFKALPFFAVALGLAVGLLILILPFFIAAKITAGEKATAGRIFGNFGAHILVGVFIGVAMIFFTVVSNIPPFVWSLIIFFLCVAITAAIYQFSFWRGVLYEVIIHVVPFVMLCLIALPFYFMDSGRPVMVSAYRYSQMKDHSPTEKDSKAAAIKKYPALAVAGSPFNTRFLERHTKLKNEAPHVFDLPDWPMILADQVDEELSK